MSQCFREKGDLLMGALQQRLVKCTLGLLCWCDITNLKVFSCQVSLLLVFKWGAVECDQIKTRSEVSDAGFIVILRVHYQAGDACSRRCQCVPTLLVPHTGTAASPQGASMKSCCCCGWSARALSLHARADPVAFLLTWNIHHYNSNPPKCKQMDFQLVYCMLHPKHTRD